MHLVPSTRLDALAGARPARIRRMVALPQRDAHGTAPATLATFDGLMDMGEHVALIWNPPADRPLVRIHSECLTGDALGSARCDCGEQLAETRALLSEVGGILLYLRQEGRGIGLYNKIDAYALQDQGADTVDANVRLGFPADARDYGVAAQMLLALGYSQVRLLTNNPKKIAGLESGGVRVADRVGTGLHVLPANHAYLETKRIRMGHLYETCPLPAPAGRG